MCAHVNLCVFVQVLDWEMSTIGHPLADVCNLVGYTFPSPLLAGMFSGTPAPPPPTDPRPLTSIPPAPALDTPLAVQLRYCEHAGVPVDEARLPFFRVFFNFKSAVILHGVAARAARGVASSEQAAALAAFVPVLAQQAMDETGLPSLAQPSKL